MQNAETEIRIAEIEKEISVFQKQQDALDVQIDEINKQKDMLDKQIEGIDKQIEALEKARDAEVKRLEDIKKMWEDIAGSYEKQRNRMLAAQMLGANWESDILSGRLDVYENFKNQYNNIQAQLHALDEDGTAQALSDTATSATDLGTAAEGASGGVSSLGSAASNAAPSVQAVSDAMDGVESSASNTASSIDEEATKLDNVADAADKAAQAKNAFVEANSKVKTSADESVTSLGNEKDAFDNIQSSIDKINEIDSEGAVSGIDSLKTKLLELKDVLTEINGILGGGMEEAASGIPAEAGPVGGLVSSLQNLGANTDGIQAVIDIFNSLTEAIEGASNALSGGGGGEVGNGLSGMSGKGGMPTGIPGGEGGEGGGSGLTGAIEAVKQSADTNIGAGAEAEEGTTIGDFNALKGAVENVTTAIGMGGEEGSDAAAAADAEGGGTLTSAITSLSETTANSLGESSGDGAIGKFEEFDSVIEQAGDHVQDIISKLDEIDGKEVTATVTIQVNNSGGLATGTAIDGMVANIGETKSFEAKFAKGAAHVEGTAEVSGDWGVRKAGRALTGELGQEIVVRRGKFFTVGDNGPEFVDLQDGDIVFNHLKKVALYGDIQ